MATAILVDGGFFEKRYRFLRGSQSPAQAAKDLHWMSRQHLKNKETKYRRRLYRIFFYDCPPLTKTVHNPVTGQVLNFRTTPTATWRIAFHDELRRQRKVALRLGYLNERSGHWIIKPQCLKSLFRGQTQINELTEKDVPYSVNQKGVDMRIGLDIASMSYKRQVDQIVLVAGDSDFVPAAKLARREGVDFILDPMWAQIRSDLHEHIDGLRSVLRQQQTQAPPEATAAIDGDAIDSDDADADGDGSP